MLATGLAASSNPASQASSPLLPPFRLARAVSYDTNATQDRTSSGTSLHGFHRTFECNPTRESHYTPRVTIAQALWSVSKGVLILGIAGTFWLGVGLGPGSYRIGIAPWLAVLTVMVVGVVAFRHAALAIGRRSGFRRSDLNRRDPATRR